MWPLSPWAIPTWPLSPWTITVGHNRPLFFGANPACGTALLATKPRPRQQGSGVAEARGQHETVPSQVAARPRVDSEGGGQWAGALPCTAPWQWLRGRGGSKGKVSDWGQEWVSRKPRSGAPMESVASCLVSKLEPDLSLSTHPLTKGRSLQVRRGTCVLPERDREFPRVSHKGPQMGGRYAGIHCLTALEATSPALRCPQGGS